MQAKADKHIVAVEGPAGSGKSYLASRLLREFRNVLAPTMPEFNRPRSYSGDWGIQLSQLKDYRSLLAMASPDDWQATTLIDRFVMSQAVYGEIRRGWSADRPDTPTIGNWMQTLRHAFSMLRAIELDHVARSLAPLARPELQYHLHYVVMLPNYDFLEELRDQGGKTYPYPAKTEVALYDRFTSHGLDVGLRRGVCGFHVKIHPIFYSSFATLTNSSQDVVDDLIGLGVFVR
jgi:hypothetical protein